MQKLKRILALIGAVLLAGMYLVVLVLGLTASPKTRGALMAAIACTVIIPCLLYAMMLIARVLDTRKSRQEDVREPVNPGAGDRETPGTSSKPTAKKEPGSQTKGAPAENKKPTNAKTGSRTKNEKKRKR